MEAGCSTASGTPALAQHEITSAGELLQSGGRLREPGWSRLELLHWDPSLVANPSQLRQWDFFTILSSDAAVNLTLADLGFAQVATVGVIDFATGAKHESTVLKAQEDAFALSSAALADAASLTPAGSPAPVLSFASDGESTTVVVDVPASLLGDAAQGSFTIVGRPSLQYLSLATPFHDDAHQFFYEQKIPGLSADGTLRIGDGSWSFSPESDSAVMDWGRGQWPASVTWRWGGASGLNGGIPVALNLGEGFGVDTAGTENLVVVNDVAHKLGRVEWTHDASNPLEDWSFSAADGSVSLLMHPIAPETGGLDFGAKFTHLFKAYGRWSGSITLDDGSTLTVDNLLGFAEEENLAW